MVIDNDIWETEMTLMPSIPCIAQHCPARSSNAGVVYNDVWETEMTLTGIDPGSGVVLRAPMAPENYAWETR